MAGVTFCVTVDLLDTRKFSRLQAKLGAQALTVLFRLWSYTRLSAHTGDLGDIDPFFLAVTIIRWTGDHDVLWDALVGGGWIDQVAGTSRYAVHDWDQHNWYASTLDARREKGRTNALKRWGLKSGSSGESHGSPIGSPNKTPKRSPNNQPSGSPSENPNGSPNAISYSNSYREGHVGHPMGDPSKVSGRAEPVPPTAAPFSEEDQPQEHNGPVDLTEERAKRDILQTLGRDPERLRKAEVSALKRIVAAKVPLDAVKEAHRRKSGEGVFKKGLDYLEPIIMEIHEEMARKLIEDRQREERNRELDRVNLAQMRGNNGRAH